MEILIKSRENKVKVSEEDVRMVQELANDRRVPSAADFLGIEVRTLEGRLARLRGRLGLKTIHGLVYLFYKNGLIK